MAYRNEVEALKSREAALERELEETRAMRIAATRRSLPVLEELRVASPCPEKWEDMIGDDVVRFCARCAKSVYDLSAMTREQAEEFVRQKSGPVCVTMRRRRDGKVITNDCPAGVRRRRFGVGVIALATAGTAAAAFALLAHEDPAPSHCPNVTHGHDRHELAPGPAERRASDVKAWDTVTTGVITTPVEKEASRRTTGCLCQPGDPLCSCL
jgi:hypothetical protein